MLVYTQCISYVIVPHSLSLSLRPPLASMLSTPTFSRNNSLNNHDQQTPNTLDSNTPPVHVPPSTLLRLTPPQVTSTLSYSPISSPPQVTSTLGDGPITSPSQTFSPRKSPGRRTRQYYGQNFGYIMDAKTKGNVGRYINVSAKPLCVCVCVCKREI